MKFFDNNQNEVDLRKEIESSLKDGYDYSIYVGTDSQVHSNNNIVFATAVVLHKKGKGGKAFIAKERFPNFSSLRQRLVKEVWTSIEVAFSLHEFLSKGVEIVVHVDSNRDKVFKSGLYTEELISMVVSQGFKCVVKPDSWAACTVADRISK